MRRRPAKRSRKSRASSTSTSGNSLRCLLVLALVASSGAQAALAPGDHTITLQHAGIERSYIVHVPAQVKSPAAVIVAFHGGGGNARGQQEYSRLDALADREGILAVYPDGTGRMKDRLLVWNAGSCCGVASARGVDDVGFVAALLDDLAARTAIDPKRVFATGMSNGAMMAHRVAAELPGRIAAIAPVAGAMVFTGAIKQAVPVLHIHSIDDPRALYGGGLGPPFPMTNSRVMHPAVTETLARWSVVNGCKGEPRATESRNGSGPTAAHTATLLVYQGCSAPLEHWKLTGAGHVWPGGQRDRLQRILGPGTDVIDANEEMWKFFSKAGH